MLLSNCPLNDVRLIHPDLRFVRVSIRLGFRMPSNFAGNDNVSNGREKSQRKGKKRQGKVQKKDLNTINDTAEGRFPLPEDVQVKLPRDQYYYSRERE